MIELKGIVREYRNGDVVTPALTGIDLCIRKGEFAAVMGASGSGKTTLLHIMGCMDAPTSGIYRLDGEHLERASEKRLSAIRGQKISFVFQHFALLEDCTAAENVALPLLRQRMSGAERRAKVLAALEQVGIADLARRKPSQLSGGQKQRTAIARAIVCGADILLADEPTGALDSRTGAEIMGVFQELNRMGKTIVIITHDRQVASCANRLIEMQDGRIIHDEAI
ncbi:MAG: ABC transporter ATP-binding protein [Acutalibacteraceae bacterium]